MNQYIALKEQQRRKFNNFAGNNMFYAFSEEQKKEGMKNLKLDPEADADKIIYITAGGYCLKEKEADALQLLKSFREEIKTACKEDTTGEGFIYDMYRAELLNHEYSYTGDYMDAVDATPFTLEEIQATETLKHGFEKAINACN